MLSGAQLSIPDSQLSASGALDNCGSNRARLNTLRGWRPESSDPNLREVDSLLKPMD